MARSLKLSNDDYIDLSGINLAIDYRFSTNLNNEYGTCAYNENTVSRPSDYGFAITFGVHMRDTSGNRWVYQIAFGTNSHIYVRNRINANTDGWNPWKEIPLN